MKAKKKNCFDNDLISLSSASLIAGATRILVEIINQIKTGAEPMP